MRSPEEIASIQARTRLLFLYVFGAVCLCAIAYWFVQVIRGPYYSELAENNQYQENRISAPRGKILDRSGETVLLDNRPAFNLYIIPERCDNLQETIQLLRGLVSLGSQELAAIRQRRRVLRSFQPLLIKEDIPFELMAYFEARATRYPWLYLAVEHKRSYTHGETASHLLGHVGEISEAQLNAGVLPDARPGEIIGQAGIERQYNPTLSGRDGKFVQVVDSVGRVIREVSRDHPLPGNDVLLTIDFRLQRKAEELFRDKAGALVALDVHNGELLALVSAPGFDPNRYVELFPTLASDESSPLLNRAISSKFSPGSVWKVLIAAAALQEGIITPEKKEFCAGAVNLAGRFFHCNKSSGHGWVDLVEAITHSCNVYFYKLGHKLGIERVAKWARRFGFGDLSGVDLPYEVSGLVPTPEWKQRVYKEKWYPSETVSVSIGQGPLEVSPLQMAVFMAAVANGGKLVRPHLVLGVRGLDGTVNLLPSPQTTSVGVDAEHLSWIRKGMYGTVNRGGTAVRARIPQISAAGKTGTAQVIRKRLGVKPEDLPEELRHHAWFVCFAPYENPEIAVCVFVEHGGTSSISSVPLAAEFLKTYAEVRLEAGASANGRVIE